MDNASGFQKIKEIFINAGISAQKTDKLGLFILIIGAIMVYGSGYIIKIFRLKFDEAKTVKFKLLGLTIAIIGMLKIFGII